MQINKITIPNRLQNNDIGFVKLLAKTKLPFEKGWPSNPYSIDEIKEWVEAGNNYGVMGGHAGIVIVDADSVAIRKVVEEYLPKTFTVKSRAEKRHYYFKCPELKEKIVFNDEVEPRQFLEGETHYGEIISTGAQVVGPGSIHPDTQMPYEVVEDIEIAHISKEELLSCFANFLKPSYTEVDSVNRVDNFDLSVVDILRNYGVNLTNSGNQALIVHPIHGSKNGGNVSVNIAKNSWYCFRCECGGGPMQLIAVMERIISCDQCVKHRALTGEDFIRTKNIAIEKHGLKAVKYLRKPESDSITNTSSDDGGKKSQASLIVEEIEANKDIVLFHDEASASSARIKIGDHFEISKVRSKHFKKWIGKIFWEKHQKAPNSDAINTALNIIESKCMFDGPEIKLSNRVAWHENEIWYDLTDKTCRAVKITPSGWYLVNNPPILFRGYSHQEEQVEPVSGGDINEVLKYVNIQNDKHKILFLVYLVSCFIPDFPHPVLNVYGPQGSAKSSLSKVVRRIVDPSILEVTEFPKTQAELVQKLSHHWLIFFDNVSNIPDFISDILCRVVTGSGFSKRELYTDDEDIIYILKRCVGINGINLTSEKADLLERSILLELERVTDDARKEERLLFEVFEINRSRILGAIFDILVKAIKIKPEVSLQSMPRMADFAVWGCAISEAMGYTREVFLDAYYENISDQNKEVILESLIASSVLSFMADKGEWQDTPSKLLKELKQVAINQGVDVDKENGFPKAANKLSKQLNLIKTNLAVSGIKLERGEGNNQRYIKLLNTKYTKPVDENQKVADPEHVDMLEAIDSIKDSFDYLQHDTNDES